MNTPTFLKKIILISCSSFLIAQLFSCQKKEDSSSSANQATQAPTENPEAAPTPNPTLTPAPTSTPESRYLYFASGGCYAGGLATTRPTSVSASGFVSRISLDHAEVQARPVFDYFQASLNLWPVGITNYDHDYLLANVMTSTAGFRIDKIKKSSLQEKSDFIVDLTNLNSVLRSITMLDDKSLLISRSSIVEKYNSSTIRITNSLGTASFINNPLDVCSNSKTLISSVLPLPNRQILMTHAGGASNNRLFIIDKDGYDSTTDCKSAYTFSAADSTAMPGTVAVPTAAVLVSKSDPYQVIVSTSATVGGNDQLWLFSISATTNAITFVKSLHNDVSYIKGVSAMTYDETEKTLYVANGSTSYGNTIEKFSYDLQNQKLDRVNTFLGLNFDTQCINSMFISN